MTWRTVYVVGHFVFHVPILMTVMAFMSSLGIGVLLGVISGIEAAVFSTIGLLIMSSGVFGVGILTALIMGTITCAIRDRLSANTDFYEKQLVKFVGGIGSFVALLIYPLMVEITMLNLTDTEHFIGRIVYAVVVCILTMIANLSEIDWVVENFIRKTSS